jgi:cytochrome P450
VFVFQDSAQAISLEIILRAIFGVEDDPAVDRFVSIVKKFVDVASPLVMFTKMLQHEFFGFGPWAKTQKALREWDALTAEQIRLRRAREGGDDILGMMLAARYEDGERMSDDHVRDELVTLVFAGHETTALALSWAMYWLHRDRERLERLCGELDAAGGDPEKIAASPYLDAVCSETLRLHPIVPDPLRMCAKPFTLRGWEIPAGVGVAAVSALAHIDPVVWPEPLKFRPERFLERTYKPWEYLPFGGGARRCIGAAFSVYEMKQVLAVAIGESEYELCEEREVVPVRRSVTMGPSTGVRLRRRGTRGMVRSASY